MPNANARVVVIGWHGADWRFIHPLVDEGLMPNLRALIERGVVGNLRPSGPPVPAMLWTSISTGKSADEHGVLSAAEPDPLTGGIRPAGSRACQVKALWNIAMQAGYRSHVIRWSGTDPAETLNGSCVAPSFLEPLGRFDSAWPVFPGSISPQRLVKDIAELRVHPGELKAEDLRPFIPLLHEIDQRADRRVIAFADTLARTISTHAISTWLMQHEPWNLMLIGWDGVQRACQMFMRCAPPLLPGVHPDDCRQYGSVVRAMYCYHDMLLGRVIELAGPEASIAIVSPAGFRSGNERPISKIQQNRMEAWYRPYGVFCMSGPPIVPDELVHNVTMYDVTPTILHALGIPAAADMPGRVITEAFRDAGLPERIPSWETVAGNSGKSSSADDEYSIEGAMAELRDLGYVDCARSESIQRLERERLFNKALVYLSRLRYEEARATLTELQQSQRDPHTSVLLAYVCYRLGDLEAALNGLRDVAADGPFAANAKLLESFVALAQGDRKRAGTTISVAERLGFDRPVVLLIVAVMYVRLGQLSRAEAALQAALELDASFEKAHALLARVLSATGRTARAVASARAGLAVEYGSASLHSALGIALAHSDPAAALQEFETALLFDPQLSEAARWSAALQERKHKTA